MCLFQSCISSTCFSETTSNPRPVILSKNFITARVRSTREGNVSTWFVSSWGKGGVPRSLVPSPFPASDPRSFPGEGGTLVCGPLSFPRGGGTPVRSGYPPPPPLDRIRLGQDTPRAVFLLWLRKRTFLLNHGITTCIKSMSLNFVRSYC